jgi:sulfotransferase family protein
MANPSDAGRLPTFLIVGAQKSGTSSLHKYLGSHPQVFVSSPKEVDFFVEEREWRRGVRWYRDVFAGAGDATAVGEASPQYSFFPVYAGVPDRIASLVPDARIIYVMRDPVERMGSAYRHTLSSGVETRPIADALLQDARYADTSRYAMQIEQYLRRFPIGQMLLLTAEELRFKREETLARVLEFIGVDAAWRPPDLADEYNSQREKTIAPRPRWRELGDFTIRHNLTRFVPASVARLHGHPRLYRPITDEEVRINDDLRHRLQTVLRPDVERLATWMGPSFDGWGLLNQV